MLTRMLAVGLLAIGGAVPSAAIAREVIVQMKTQGQGGMMVFDPAYILAEPGDVVRFLPTDPSHNAEFIPGMVPHGVAIASGAIGKEFDVTLTKPGLYGIRCRPHFALGMVALIKAGRGRAANASEAMAAPLPALASKRMAPMLARQQ